MYYLVFAYLIILYLLPIRDKKIKIIAGLLPIAVLAVLRFGVGADYFSYSYIYDYINTLPLSEVKASFGNIDVGFLMVLKFFAFLRAPFQLVIAALSLLQIILVGLWIKDSSEEPVLSIIIYYAVFLFVWNFSALRQGVVLSFAAYFLFNKRFDLKVWQELILIAFLCLFHFSALILLVYVIAKRMNFSSKVLWLLFAVAIVSTFIPFELILTKLSFIPGVGRLIPYFQQEGSSLLSFASIIRIGMFAVTMLFYNSIIEKPYERGIVQTFVLGFIIYIALSFAPVAAGRLVAYFYFLAILVIPMVVVTHRNAMRYVVLAGTLGFTSLSLYKELNTMVDQSYMDNDAKLVPYTHILNKDKVHFSGFYATSTNEFRLAQAREKEFYENEKTLSETIVKPSEGDSFYSVWSSSLKTYIIINQNGERISDDVSYIRLNIWGSVMQYPGIADDFPAYYYRDLVSNRVVYEQEALQYHNDAYQSNGEIPQLMDMTLSNVKGYDTIVPYPDETTNVKVYYFEKSDYYLIRFDYFGRRLAIYTDADMQPIANRFFYSTDRIKNKEFIMNLNTQNREIYNRAGKLIWIEPLGLED